MNERMAFDYGKDCGLNGANAINSHFGIFSQPGFTKAWKEGKASVQGEDFKCPECNEKVWKSVENGAMQLGEDPNKRYDKYNCDKCKLFWEKGDALCTKQEDKVAFVKKSDLIDVAKKVKKDEDVTCTKDEEVKK